MNESTHQVARVLSAPTPAAVRPEAEVATADPHPWRATVVLTLCVVAAGLAYSFWIVPAWQHSPAWYVPTDAWVPLKAAHYVANGAYPFLYEADFLFVATPLLPVLLAPVAAAGESLGLTENHPYAGILHPSAWPPLAVCGLALGALLLTAARSVGRELASRARAGWPGSVRSLPWAQVAVTALVLVPATIVFGHYEDALALGFMCFALIDVARGRWTRAAVLLGVAAGFKQWALLEVPLLVAISPRDLRVRTLAISAGIPAVLVAPMLIADWPNASEALLRAPAYPMFGHAAVWLADRSEVIAGSPFRAMSFVFAGVVAWRLRGRPELRALLAGMAVIFLCRLLTEPVIFAHYLAVPLGFLALHEVARTGRAWRTILGGAVLLLGFLLHPNEWIWWSVFVPGCAALAWPAVLDVSGRSIRPAAGSPAAAGPR